MSLAGSSGHHSSFPAAPLTLPSSSSAVAAAAAAAAPGKPRPFLNGVFKAACNFCVRCGSARTLLGVVQCIVEGGERAGCAHCIHPCVHSRGVTHRDTTGQVSVLLGISSVQPTF